MDGVRWMGTVTVAVTLLSCFCLPIWHGSTLKGKNLLHMEQILSLKSRPHFEIALNRKSQICSPL